MTDPEKLDAEIALLRGMTVDENGIWTCHNEGTLERWYVSEYGYGGRVNHVPTYSSDWALAGPLLEEMRVGSASPRLCVGEMLGEWCCEADNALGGPDVPRAEAATPCQAIARAWLAWRKARP